MATVKVRLGLPSEGGRQGTVFYQVTHRSRTRRISTSIRLAAEDWDAAGCRVKARAGHAEDGAPVPRGGRYRMEPSSLQDRIDSGLVRLRMIIWYLDGMRREYTVDDIVYRYGLQEDRATVMSFMDARIGQLISSGRLGTARNHNIPVSVISAAMGHQSEKTTQIYLAMLEDSVIDSANQEIISCIK